MSGLWPSSGRHRGALAGLLVLAVAVAVGAVTIAGDERPTEPDRSPPTSAGLTPSPPTLPPTKCKKVEVIGATPGSPYARYAELLAKLIGNPDLNGHNGWSASANNSITTGTSASLARLAANPKCILSTAQLNVPVDAIEGLGDFKPENSGKIEELRYVGQIYSDLVHLVVPADSGIDDAVDLCGKTVLQGRIKSGTYQISRVLIRQVQERQGCVVNGRADEGIDVALGQLHAEGDGRVDGVFWAAGAPTEAVSVYIRDHPVKLVPLAGWRDAVEADWLRVYEDVGARIFGTASIGPADYAGISETPTFGTPNGIVAHEDTDTALVIFATYMIYGRSAEFERELWPRGSRGTFATPRSFIETGLCRYVPLHRATYDYYTEVLGHNPTDEPARCRE